MSLVCSSIGEDKNNIYLRSDIKMIFNRTDGRKTVCFGFRYSIRLISVVSLVLDDGQLEFEKKLKRYVHLELLLKVLTYDRKHMEHLKFADIYRQVLDKIMDEIMKEMTEIRRYFRQSSGRIIETEKEFGKYVVRYTYKGYQFEVKYLREFIRVECGEILKEYLRQCLPDG